MAKFTRLRIFVAAALIQFLVCASPALAGAKQGWVVMQRSNFLGRRDVYLTDTAFKAFNPVTGHILITTAPDWQVLIANTRSKLYFRTAYESWMGRKVAVGEKTVRGMANQKPVRTPGRRVICGLKANMLKIDASQGLEKRYFRGERDVNDLDRSEYWVTGDLPFPEPARKTICTFYQLPLLSQFPVEVNYRRCRRDSDISHLATTSVKKENIDDSVFTIPKTFRKAHFEAEVWVDDKTRMMLEMFR